MRVTVDIPDALFERAKAAVQRNGTSIREIVIQALERVSGNPTSEESGPQGRRVTLPLVRLGHGRVLDLHKFNFDELMG